MSPDPQAIRQRLRLSLLNWYDKAARDLPWRVAPADRQRGHAPDPYHVWLSEIMLQQTTVVTVKPYFETFLRKFPRLEDLASAPLDQVLGLWAGLGYYARARNLHAGAKALASRSTFPRDVAGLLEIPGIGPYTAAAVAAIAFDQPVVPVDGNVERVLSRLWRIDQALPAAKPVFRTQAAKLADPHRPGDFAQALMDLGAGVCTPRKPNCLICPLQDLCQAYQADEAESYPKKQSKKAKPRRFGWAYVIVTPDGLVVRRRPDRGLLGGMLEIPGSAWHDDPTQATFAPPHWLGLEHRWVYGENIRHVFTHFDLQICVAATRILHRIELPDHQVLALSETGAAALPRVMRKIIDSGLEALKAHQGGSANSLPQATSTKSRP